MKFPKRSQYKYAKSPYRIRNWPECWVPPRRHENTFRPTCLPKMGEYRDSRRLYDGSFVGQGLSGLDTMRKPRGDCVQDIKHLLSVAWKPVDE
jgi:hypothetical protein